MTVIDRSIQNLKLKPGDALVVNKSFFGISDPYAIYLGREDENHLFLVRDGAKIGCLPSRKIPGLFHSQTLRRVNRFAGDPETRMHLISNAKKRHDRHSYTLLLNHCEDAVGYTRRSSSRNPAAVAGGILGVAALIALAAILLGKDD